MNSKRSHEGVMTIDHSASPGVPDEIMVKSGYWPGAGKGKQESATFTCAHCERVVVVNPKRTRERGYCPKCDHYVCDTCETHRVASGYQCFNFKAMVDRLLNKAEKDRVSEVFQPPNLIIR